MAVKFSVTEAQGISFTARQNPAYTSPQLGKLSKACLAATNLLQGSITFINSVYFTQDIFSKKKKLLDIGIQCI